MTVPCPPSAQIHALDREFAERRFHVGAQAQELFRFERLDVKEDLRSERFVDLPEVAVDESKPVSNEQAKDRESRRPHRPFDPEVEPDNHDPRVDRRPGQRAALSNKETADILTFLETLNDGYSPSSPGKPH